jgi:GR25 family glycosyltransferase involved in LPS biosynthesis
MKQLYINLDSATSRRIIMEKTFPDAIRIPAIYDEKGYLGCTKSHIECIRTAIREGWDAVCILEDDAMIHNQESMNCLEELLKNPYDVILLGGSKATFDKSTLRLHSSFTTSGYIVAKHYYKTLLSNFEEGLQQSLKDPRVRIDTYWKLLQQRDQWYIVNPAYIIQRPGYSHIEKKVVDYRSLFNI